MAEFYKKVLDNGASVIFEKRDIPVVSLSIGVNNGAEFEAESEKGISHFIEHLVFNGTKNRTREEICREIEKKGGILNASTSEEMTSFFCKVPARHLSQGLNILSDIFFNPLLSKKAFEKEKKVILEEIRMFKDNPMLYVSDKIKELLYKKPFGLSVAGDFKSVASFEREQVIRKYRERFCKRVIVSAAGKAEFEEICNFANKFPKCEADFLKTGLGKINSEAIEKRKGIDQAHFIFGYHSPALAEKGLYLNTLIMTYLAGGMSSILNNEIREKRGLAYVIKPDVECEKNYGFSSVYVGTEKKNLKEVKDIILKNFKKSCKIPAKDFEEMKEQLIGLREISGEDCMNVMQSLAIEELGDGAEEYYKFEERVNALKLEDARNFKLKGFSSFAIVPE